MQIHDGRVIPEFHAAGDARRRSHVYGDGRQTRSFCYVSDEVEGILRLSRSPEHTPVNIGNPSEFTILGCAQQVLAATGSKSQIRHEALPQDDPKQRRPDISKARLLLDWEPRIDLPTGLRMSLDYFRRAVAEQAPLPGVTHGLPEQRRTCLAGPRAAGRSNFLFSRCSSKRIKDCTWSRSPGSSI